MSENYEVVDGPFAGLVFTVPEDAPQTLNIIKGSTVVPHTVDPVQKEMVPKNG